MDSNVNRREYYRIDDRIALQMKPLEHGARFIEEDVFEQRRRELGLANHFAANQEKHRAEKKRIEQKHPEIAAYLSYLEEEIQVLATRIASSDACLPSVPTHDVNICAEGIRLELPGALPEGQSYAMCMLLFPSNTAVFTVGEVVRSIEITEGDELQIGHHTVAIRFTQLDDEDKEALVKHVHQKQLLQLQERQSILDSAG